jgi:hypothetical protein
VVISQDDLYVESLFVDGKQLPSNIFRVSPGIESHLQITIARSRQLLQGITIDDGDKPVAAEVLVMGEDTGIQRVSTSDSEGRFSFEGLPEDRYLVLAWLSREGIPFNSPEILAQLKSSFVELTFQGQATQAATRIPIVHFRAPW